MWCCRPLSMGSPQTKPELRYCIGIFRSARTSWNTFIRPFINTSVCPQDKSKSLPKSCKSSKDHSRPLKWNVGYSRTDSSSISRTFLAQFGLVLGSIKLKSHRENQERFPVFFVEELYNGLLSTNMKLCSRKSKQKVEAMFITKIF